MRGVIYLIVRKVLREDVKSIISSAIMKGEYKPGDRIVETQIAKDLNVSQAPVREALRDLEQMGIVVTEPYKGTYVRDISRKDLISYYDVRAELEGLAMRLAMPNLKEKDIKKNGTLY